MTLDSTYILAALLATKEVMCYSCHQHTNKAKVQSIQLFNNEFISSHCSLSFLAFSPPTIHYSVCPVNVAELGYANCRNAL